MDDLFSLETIDLSGGYQRNSRISSQASSYGMTISCWDRPNPRLSASNLESLRIDTGGTKATNSYEKIIQWMEEIDRAGLQQGSKQSSRFCQSFGSTTLPLTSFVEDQPWTVDPPGYVSVDIQRKKLPSPLEAHRKRMRNISPRLALQSPTSEVNDTPQEAEGLGSVPQPERIPSRCHAELGKIVRSQEAQSSPQIPGREYQADNGSRGGTSQVREKMHFTSPGYRRPMFSAIIDEETVLSEHAESTSQTLVMDRQLG
jgi:hypothetical protein